MKGKPKKRYMPDRSWPGSPTTALPTDCLRGGSDKCATGAKPKLKLPTLGLTIGTWNVRTLNQTGRVHELTHELKRYKWDIIGLAEVRWTGFGETNTEDGHKIWYSGEEMLHQHGVGFIVRKEIVPSIISCTPVSSRLISIRVSSKPQNITIIQAYAPTSDYDDDQVEEFYENLESIIAKTPKKDILIVEGDWNAKVGPDAYSNWPGTAGRFGIGETNDRGQRLLEFARKHRLTLANTLHPHKPSRTTTWHSPNGLVHNQIDFILTPQRFKSSINKANTRTFPGADIGSDHDLVLTTIKLKLKAKKQPKSQRMRFDLEKLKDPAVIEIFQANIGGKFAALTTIDDDVEILANSIKEVLTSAAEETLGRSRTKKQPWMTNEALELCDKRRELKKRKHTSQEANDKYKESHREVRRKMREAKEAWIEEQCKNIDAGVTKGNSKSVYDTLKSLTKTKQTSSSVIEDKDGNLLTENDAILQRWTDYCEGLYNYPLRPDINILSDKTSNNQDKDPPILRDEVEAAIRQLKKGKSPGIDNIPAELIKNGGEETVQKLTELCQKIQDTKNWPKEWTQSLVIPLPKKGNLKQCQNYRTISLISHPSKVMLQVILNRLKSQSEKLLAEEQAGFRPKRSTMEQIFNLRILIEKHLQHQKDIYHNFIDFRKAFDRVWHDGLWQVLRQFNIDNCLIEIIKALYDNAHSAVFMNNQVGTSFKTTVGVRQGCLLSPVLFNLFLENIMTETLQNHQSTISIGGRSLCNLRFADDIDLMGGSKQELQNLTNRLSERANAYGMEVSTEKSKVMVNSTNNDSTEINMNGEVLEEVNQFKYLGSILTKDGTSNREVKARIAAATSALVRLERVFKSNNISFRTKYHLYKSLVTSILMYGCESWTLTAELEKRIQAFENKCHRKLLKISYKEHKTNAYVKEEIRKRMGHQEPLLSTIKRRKLIWFGHTTRHDTLAKTILQGTLEGKRKRGRQKKSWLDNIKEWTNQPVQHLLEATQDREGWKKISAASSLMSPLRPFRTRD